MKKPYNHEKIVKTLLSRKVKPFVIFIDSLLITLFLFWIFSLNFTLINVLIGTASISVPYALIIKMISKKYNIK